MGSMYGLKNLVAGALVSAGTLSANASIEDYSPKPKYMDDRRDNFSIELLEFSASNFDLNSDYANFLRSEENSASLEGSLRVVDYKPLSFEPPGVDPNVVPLPSSLISGLVLGSGVVGFSWISKRRRN